MATEAEMGAMRLKSGNASSHQEPDEARTILLRSPIGRSALPPLDTSPVKFILDFWPLNCGGIRFGCLKPTGLGNKTDGVPGTFRICPCLLSSLPTCPSVDLRLQPLPQTHTPHTPATPRLCCLPPETRFSLPALRGGAC